MYQTLQEQIKKESSSDYWKTPKLQTHKRVIWPTQVLFTM